MRELGRGGAAAIVAGLAVVVLAGACSHGDDEAKLARLPVASQPTSTTTAPAGGVARGPKGGGVAAAPTSTGPSAAAGSKAGFLVAANAICKTANDQLTKVGDDVSDPTASQEADILEQGAGIMQTSLDQMHALPPPGGDIADLQTFYDKSVELLALIRQTATSLRAGDSSLLSQLQSKGDPINTASEQAADRYGLTQCGTSREDS